MVGGDSGLEKAGLDSTVALRRKSSNPITWDAGPGAFTGIEEKVLGHPSL